MSRRLTAFWSRLRSIVRRRQAETDLTDELRFHLDRQIETFVGHGMTPEAARREALLALGGLERRKEECRDARGISALEDVVRDARLSIRSFLRRPAFALTAIITIGLGVGASTTLFSVVSGVLLRPLPYHDPERLVVVPTSYSTVTPATFFDLREGTHVFEASGLAEFWTPTVTGDGPAQERYALHVTPELLPMLGVSPLLGRLFGPEDGLPGHDQLVVLRHDLWRTAFAGDSGVIGRSIVLDGKPYEIVGVMPEGFQFAPFWATEAQLWSPVNLDARRNDREGQSFRMFARLRPGVTVEQADADLHAVAMQLVAEFPGSNTDVHAVPLLSVVVGDVETVLWAMFGATALLLVIACANVTHLQLVRSTARAREFSLRTALGGSRRRLLQQALVESAVLATAGGLLGLAIAWASVVLLRRFSPESLPRIEAVALDLRVAAFALLSAFVAGAIAGLAPALAVTRGNPREALVDGGRSGDSRQHRRWRGALVISQFALTLVLLAGSGLLIRSLTALQQADPGYRPHQVLSLEISLRGTASDQVERRLGFFRDIVDQTRRLPGVSSASAINHLPLNGDNWFFHFDIEGRPLAEPGKRERAQFLVIHPGYFETMGIPLLRGRDFGPADSDDPHVVIISAAMARHYWPDESPLGHRISVDDAAEHADWFTIVGVAGDVRQNDWADADFATMYYPSAIAGGYPWKARPLVTMLNPEYMTLVVRTTAPATSISAAIAELVGARERNAVISNVITLDGAIDAKLSTPRFYSLLLGGFAAAALLLSAVGIYGVIGFTSARRVREMGLRLALGADPMEPFRLVVGDGVRLAAIGLLVGVAGALVATRLLTTVLYQTQPTDPVSFTVACLLLALVGILASAIPAWRATRVDPASVLRAD